MNIAIDATILVSHFRGGVLVYTERLVEHLARIDRDTHYQLLLAGLRLDPASVALEVGRNFGRHVLPVPDRPFPGRAALWREVLLPTFFETHSTDLFHLPARHDLTAWPGVKRVITIHDLRSVHLPGEDPQDLRWMKRSCHRADAVIAVSEFTRRDIIREFSVPEHKVHTVPLGVDEVFRVAYEPEATAELLGRLGIDRPFFLCLGLVPRKNIERLLEAYAGFRHRDAIRLVLAGHTGGAHVNKYRALVRQHGLEGQVLMPGSVPLHELVLLYNATLAFTFPSLCEGFGIPVLEAMACGAPVLTSNISALPEVAGDAAVIVDPKDPNDIRRGMDMLADDKELRERLSIDGRARAATFQWETMAREILGIYRSLV